MADDEDVWVDSIEAYSKKIEIQKAPEPSQRKSFREKISFFLNWGASSRWSSSLYCLMQNSDEMTIGKTPSLYINETVRTSFAVNF